MDNVVRQRTGSVRGSIELDVRVTLFTDEGGNDRLRVEAYFEGKNGSVAIGGVDIMPSVGKPLFNFVQHSTPFTKKGVELAISSVMLGAAGPIVGECIESNRGNIISLRRCVEFKIDDIADAAFQSALTQAETFHASE